MLESIIQTLRFSFKSILDNKGRSMMTMAGIVIGVSSVMVIMSIGAGAQNFILSRVESLGTNLLNISPGSSDGDDPLSQFSTFAVTTLKYEDVEYLQNHRGIPHVVAVAGYNKGFASVAWRSETYEASLTGTTASYFDLEESEVESGRTFTKEEERNLSRVAVLGSGVKEGLFGASDAVGARIKMNNTSFEVIGVMAERGVVPFEDFDNQVILPVKTMQRMVNLEHLGLIRAKVDSEENMQGSIEDISVLLRESHGIRDATGASDDFTISTSAQRLGFITAITDGLRYFLAAMAALSLLVGGIGIMNIMLISVIERTREIGLRKAVGATNFDIMREFLLEAIFITGLGGLAGIILGALFAFVITVGVRLAGFEWAYIVSPFSIILALGVSAGIGLFFGYYPARQASKLDPIVALNYE
jgi:putative ABC transport system permease protein